MTYKERDIVHERERFWVLRVPGKTGCFEVLEKRATHSVVCGTFHFSSNPDKAREMAIAHCDRKGTKQCR